ncbi:MAG: hypothetical protein MHM6MM_003073 [Cercozoa sp. M6MM]
MSDSGPKDHSSHANLDDVACEHIYLDWTVDFEQKVLSGTATLRMRALKGGVSHVVLDTRDLLVHSVTLSDGTPLAFSLIDTVPALGQALSVTLPEDKVLAREETVSIRVRYDTSESASALQWLEPSMTAGKQQPYLFSQCQAIHARSMCPLPDSPRHKFTYEAVVRVPSGMSAVMSALSEGRSSLDTVEEFRFRQPQPIPSYLLALAVGDIERRETGPRTAVIAEPSVLEAAAHEFANVEKLLIAAETVCGPYQWTQYDVLVMPPSFPYGGMENACCTFVTPSLVAGDRSLVNVLAHEIAHSWSGNLCTNSTWQDFWLNEGFTVFVERRIIEATEGAEECALHSVVGLVDLQESVDLFGCDHEFTKLCPNLSGGIDPDDAFSSVPYEKGYNLLVHLERQVGRGVMDKYLKAHFQHFAGRSFCTSEFREFFEAFAAQNGAEISVDWDKWLHEPGMPPVRNEFDATRADEAKTLATQWLLHGASPAPVNNWSTTAKIIFLDTAIQRVEESEKEEERDWSERLRQLDDATHFSQSQNAELQFRWLQLSVRAKLPSAPEACAHFLGRFGRMKFVRPLFRALHAGVFRRQAAEIFGKLRHTYHPICAKMVARDLSK